MNINLLRVFVVCLVAITGCNGGGTTQQQSSVQPLVTTGFLSESQLPNSLTLLPPPPAVPSVFFDADKAAYESVVNIDSTDPQRYQQAIADASLAPGHLDKTFSQSTGIELSEENTPILDNLIKRVEADAAKSTVLAKDYYKRDRPFMYFDSSTCKPEGDEDLRSNGSYPSGHSSRGWAVALLLSEIIPQNQDLILKRGYEYGQSRVICRAHWQSDVNAARLMAAATIARLHANKDFLDELNLAKAEAKNFESSN